MEEQGQFTYLRLGDGELKLLLQWQEGEKPRVFQRTFDGKLEARAWLVEQDYPRLHGAFERCSYLDTFERTPYSAANFRRLHLNRERGVESPHADLSQIFYEWVYCELPGYVARHDCLFAGAEGPLLRELLKDSRYNATIGEFWPPSARVTCVGIHDNGKNYWDQLTRIKCDLIEAIQHSRADTLFLSLAAGAKILCQEISEELGIRCLDLGSMLRALTYSATPGNSLFRSSHNPFFFRVPIEAYLDALERAQPDSRQSDHVIRAQEQIKLELLRREVMYSYTNECVDSNNLIKNKENLRRFWTAKRHYRARFGPFLSSAEGRRIARKFDRWCVEQGLGVRGSLWRKWRFARKLGAGAYKSLLKHLSM